MAALISLASASAVLVGISFVSGTPGLGDFITTILNQVFQAKVLGIADAISALRKGVIQESEFIAVLKSNGFPQKEAEQFKRLTLNHLNVQEIVTLYLRFQKEPGERITLLGRTSNQDTSISSNAPSGSSRYDRKWLRESLYASGIEPELQEQIIEANRPIPNLDDIIRFAIRDVYNEEQVRLGELDQAMPQGFLDAARTRGLKESDAQSYWRAHWYIPSINQAFEMFQRLFDHPDPSIRFTNKELDQFFQLADIAPGFRSRLKEIAYHPLGRIDIRRADRVGQFGSGSQRRTKLIRAYREIGYNQKNSEFQADFTIQLNSDKTKDLTMSQTLKLYRNKGFGEDNRKKAEDQLRNVGFDDNEISLLLDFEDLNFIDSNEREKITLIERDWINNVITDETNLRIKLQEIGLSPERLSSEYSRIIRKQQEESHRLTVNEANRLFSLGIINRKKWDELMTANGYLKKDLDLLIKTFDFSQETDERFPATKDVLDWFAEGIIDDKEFVSVMTSIGYSRKNIERYAQQIGLEI